MLQRISRSWKWENKPPKLKRSIRGHIPHSPHRVVWWKSISEIVFTHGPIFSATEVSTVKSSICKVYGVTLWIGSVAASCSPWISISNKGSLTFRILVAVIWIRVRSSKSQFKGKSDLIKWSKLTTINGKKTLNIFLIIFYQLIERNFELSILNYNIAGKWGARGIWARLYHQKNLSKRYLRSL